jgi:hypothetical protein
MMPLLITFTDAESLFLCRLLCNARDAEKQERERPRLWALLQGIARGGVLLLFAEDRALLERLVEQSEKAAALIEEDVPPELRAIAECVLDRLQAVGVRS